MANIYDGIARYLDILNFVPSLAGTGTIPMGRGREVAPNRPSAPSPTIESPAAPTETPGAELPASAQALLERFRNSRADVAARARPGSPVVTPASTQAIENPTSDAALSVPPQQQDEPAEDTAGADRLARFGFAMAASRNPSLFGQLGEAGLSMLAGDRERRQDQRQNRELDVMQEYRRAQIELARAENAWSQDPNNPRNVALLAEARYKEAAAAAALRRGEGGGSASEGSGIPMEGEDGRVGIFYPRTGRVAQAPEGMRLVGANSQNAGTREDAVYQRDISTFTQATRNSPMYTMDPARQMRDATAWADERRRVRQTAGGAPRASGGTTPAPTEAPARIIDLRPGR